MTEQDGAPGGDGDDTGSTDDEHIRSLIREELDNFVTGLTDLGDGDGSGDDGDGGTGDLDNGGEPLTIREIEAAAERAARKAMKPLQDELKTRKRTPKPQPAPVEDPPEEHVSVGAKLKTLMWGGDE